MCSVIGFLMRPSKLIQEAFRVSGLPGRIFHVQQSDNGVSPMTKRVTVILKLQFVLLKSNLSVT